MLRGLKIYVAPGAQISLGPTRRRLWKDRAPKQGAMLVHSLEGATHVVLGDETSSPVLDRLPWDSEDCPQVVHYRWLSACLGQGSRQAEGEHRPPALASWLDSRVPQPLEVKPTFEELGLHHLRALLLRLCLPGHPAVPGIRHTGGQPRTTCFLSIPGFGWRRRAALEAALAGRNFVAVGMPPGQRLELPCQTLSSLMAVPAPKRRREADCDAEPPDARPLEFFLASPAQMVGAGYPGYENSCNVAEAGESSTGMPGGTNESSTGMPGGTNESSAGIPGGIKTSSAGNDNTGVTSTGVANRDMALSNNPGSMTSRVASHPLHAQPVVPAGYASTADFPATETQVPLAALDCEMCVTAAGFELTRVTVVDDEGKMLLDELVLPRAEILDYNTRYSGITPDLLTGVTTRVEDARRAVARFVGPDTVLAGHALENDLRALRLVHGRCADSALLFPRPGGPALRASLQGLASAFLNRAIQIGAHDSGEDARAALDLVLLKRRRGALLGSTARAGHTHALALLAREAPASLDIVACDRPAALQQHAAARVQAWPCHTDDQVVSALLCTLCGCHHASCRDDHDAGGDDTNLACGGINGDDDDGGAKNSVLTCGDANDGGDNPMICENDNTTSPSPDCVRNSSEAGGHRNVSTDVHSNVSPDSLPSSHLLAWACLSGLHEAQNQRAERLDPKDTAQRLAVAEAALKGAEDAAERAAAIQATRDLAAIAGGLGPRSVLVVMSAAGNTPLCRGLAAESARARRSVPREELASTKAQAASHPAVKQLSERESRGVCIILTTPDA